MQNGMNVLLPSIQSDLAMPMRFQHSMPCRQFKGRFLTPKENSRSLIFLQIELIKLEKRSFQNYGMSTSNSRRWVTPNDWIDVALDKIGARADEALATATSVSINEQAHIH